MKIFDLKNFSLSWKTLVRIRTRSGLSNRLDPDPDSKCLALDPDTVNPEPRHWLWTIALDIQAQLCLHIDLIRVLQKDVLYLGSPIAPSYMSPNGGGGGGGCGVPANEYSRTYGAQINFGDLSPYLTYDLKIRLPCSETWKFSDPKHLIILVLRA